MKKNRFTCSIHGEDIFGNANCPKCKASQKLRLTGKQIPSEFICIDGAVHRLTNGGANYVPCNEFDIVAGKYRDEAREKGVFVADWRE